MTTRRRFFLGGVGCVAASLLSPRVNAAPQDAAETGVAGNTYTSPTWGFSFAWEPGTWQVVSGSELREADLPYKGTVHTDGLTLSSADGFLSIHGFEDPRIPTGDVIASRERQTMLLAQRRDVSHLYPAIDANGFPTVGVDENGYAFGLYVVTINKPTGVPTPFSVYIECRTLATEQAFLVSTFECQPQLFEDAVPAVLMVLESLNTNPPPP